ncbi:MAG: biotin/lipoyl-binding protein [Desulfobacter sp.]|nr:biotin/lipoyl-binding protein [Desulfobacter sp.]
MKHLSTLFTTAVLIGGAVWIGISFYHAYQPQPVKLQGQIETEQYFISSKVPGRIHEVFVKKGDMITQGQLIFTLDSPEIQARLKQAKAGEMAAGALAQKAEKGTRDQRISAARDQRISAARDQRISAARDQWKKAQAASRLMEKTYGRVNNLFKDGVVSEQKKDEAFTQWQAAKYTDQAAFQMYKMAKEEAREETKQAAAQKVNMAAGAVAEVQAYMADTKIKSWFKGEVSQVMLKKGELAPQGFPVVTVVDMEDAWAVFNVREDLLSQFQKGKKFTARIPALDREITFKVTHVSVMGDFATWRTTDPNKGFDMKTFEVEARPVDRVNNLRVGMSVLVDIQTPAP